MCGRYATTLDPETLYGIFDAERVPPPAAAVDLDAAGPGEYGGDVPRPRYNIAPTTDNPVVRVRPTEHGERKLIDLLHWGLVPSWAKDASVGQKMFNARAESVAGKPAFRKALAKRRCLVPASGFFEWQKLDGEPATGRGTGRAAGRQPFYIRPADGSVMAFAGLWEYWRPAVGDDGDPVVSYTILTTAAVGRMAAIHTRMPLLLPSESWDRWLDPDLAAGQIEALLSPPSADLIARLEFRPVGPEVGNVRNDTADLLRPVPAMGAAYPLETQLALPL